MVRKESLGKVVEFAQSERNTKTFRLDQPVSDELREVMVNEVFKDFMNFMLERYYDQVWEH